MVVEPSGLQCTERALRRTDETRLFIQAQESNRREAGPDTRKHHMLSKERQNEAETSTRAWRASRERLRLERTTRVALFGP